MSKRNRRIAALLLASVMIISALLTGCGSARRRAAGKEKQPTQKEKEKVETVIPKAPVSADTGDKDSILEWGTGGREMSNTEVAEYCRERIVKVQTNLGHGTGFFIDAQGTLLTNYHVIEGADEISVRLEGGAIHSVTGIVDFSPFYDIAVLKTDITDTPYFKAAKTYSEGEKVYVRGYPRDVENSIFDEGTLGSTSEKIGLLDCIGHSASNTNGNSGGPVVNNKGEVIGISTLVYRDSQNLNFAIKLTALDHLSMDRNYSISRYREWYSKETGRSYMELSDNDKFYETYVNTVTNVTGESCLASLNGFDDVKTMKEGYSVGYLLYAYAHTAEMYDKYSDYLNSIGFEFVVSDRVRGEEAAVYCDSYNGYFMLLKVDTAHDILYVSCPMYADMLFELLE